MMNSITACDYFAFLQIILSICQLHILPNILDRDSTE